MKRMTKKILAFALSLSMLLGCAVCVSAAEAEEENRLYNLQEVEGYTLTLLDADGKEVTPAADDISGTQVAEVYANVAKLKLEFSGDASEQYVVFLLNGGSEVPGTSNIRYIDQKDGSTTVEFIIYPDQLTEEGEYTIHIATRTSYKKVGSVTVAPPLYKLGDVNNDTKINVSDAVLILQYSVEMVEFDAGQKKAGDTNKDDKINVQDAVLILRYVAELIEGF